MSNDDGASANSVADAHKFGKLAELVFGHFDLIMQGFSGVLDSTSRRWSQLHALFEKATADSIHLWTDLLVTVTLEIASEMKRRIGPIVLGYPAKLALLILREPDVECARRKAVASELAAATCVVDEAFTAKFATAFRDELLTSSHTGLLNPYLYQLLAEVFTLTPLETQEVEGMNGMLKKIYELAPAIKLPLMSDRLLIKKALASKVLRGNTPQERRQARTDALHYAVETHRSALVQFLGT